MGVVLPKKWKNDYWSRAMLLSIGYLKSIKEDSSRRFISVDTSRQCTMDQIDAFPEHISTILVLVTLPEKPDALEYAAQQGQVRACIIYEEPNTKRVFAFFSKTIGTKKDVGG
ncbi:uncharacterized protein TNCV_2200641 [Trichonephila clavipes]|nr:uncharacterized protein TNCV_2200641 [Trichonephila clavipes]